MPESAAASWPDPHIAVLAFPFGTHAAPLLAVVRRLASAEPRAHFSFLSTARSNASLFAGPGAGGGEGNVTSHDVADGVPEAYVPTGRPQEVIELFLAAAPEAFRRGVEEAAVAVGRRVSCVVSDAFLWFGEEMAAEMGVPWVAFWTAGPASLTAHICTDVIREKIGVEDIAGREDETLEFIPGLSKIRVRDLPEGILFGNLGSMFSAMLHKMGQTLPNSAAVFINSFEELDATITKHLKSQFKKFLSIGPLNLHKLASAPPPISDPNGCIRWLESQTPSSVVYVSFGSVMMPPANELMAVAEALEASGVPFLWSLQDNAKTHLPQGFPTAKGMVVPWAPQKEVLEHRAIGVFVTHCGWNSVLESMAGCTPMICRPFFGDQRVNSRTVESAWGVGVGVEGGGFTKEGLLRHLDLVLSSEEGKRMHARIKELKDVAEKAVGSNGSSTDNLYALLETVVGKTRQ